MVIPKREDPMSLAFEMAAVNNSILALVNPHNEALQQQEDHDDDDDNNDHDQQSINASVDQRNKQNSNASELRHEEAHNKPQQRDFRMYSSWVAVELSSTCKKRGIKFL